MVAPIPNGRLVGRWVRRLTAGAFALALSAGCAKQVLLEPGDQINRSLASVPPQLEHRPQDPISPYVQIDGQHLPPTVSDTNRVVKPMTLQECLVTSLKQGNVGGQGGLANPGFTNDSPGQFGGRQFGGSDSIAVLAYDPSVTYLDIERSLSKFDARWITSMQWQKLDQPVAAQFVSFQNQQDSAAFSSTLAKPLPTGGVAGITTSINYSKFSNVPTNLGTFVNPNYTPRVQFQFEQPLLQLFGVQINQISPNHPGALLINGLRSTGQGTEGILISRIRYDQQRAEFDRLINQMLLNVESAYWDLYAAYYNLYAQEEVLKQSAYLLEVVRQRVYIAQNLRQNQYFQTQLQYYQFVQGVLQARQTVLTTEGRLRGLMGMRSDDGTRIVPTDTPMHSDVKPNPTEAMRDAVAYRPELIQARYDLKALQLNLMLQKNLRRPDLRWFSSYDIAGLGTSLDGPDGQNALHDLMTNRANSWQMGLRLDFPVGMRDANALVRQAQENLYRSYYGIRDGERKVIESINRSYQNVEFTSRLVKIAKESRIAAQTAIDLQNKVIESGTWDVQTLNQLLIDQQNYARSLADEYRQMAEYTKALAGMEWARGTIQRYNNVTIAEGELPEEIKKKAIDNVTARDKALVLREHPAEFALPPLTQFDGAKTVESKTLPLPPAETAPAAPATPPKPLALPGGAVPAPSKLSQWPPANPNPATAVPAAGTIALPAKPATPVLTNGTLVESPTGTEMPAVGTLEFPKLGGSPFPAPAK
jgi:outer membrane protein TolC